MSWKLLYLLIGIVTFVAGIWRITRRGVLFPGLAGVLWFFIVLFLFYLPEVYNFVLIKGIPSFGRLLNYILLPIFIMLGLFELRHRR
jgi:hypothetical protein